MSTKSILPREGLAAFIASERFDAQVDPLVPLEIVIPILSRQPSPLWISEKITYKALDTFIALKRPIHERKTGREGSIGPGTDWLTPDVHICHTGDD